MIKKSERWDGNKTDTALNGRTRDIKMIPVRSFEPNKKKKLSEPKRLEIQLLVGRKSRTQTKKEENHGKRKYTICCLNGTRKESM